MPREIVEPNEHFIDVRNPYKQFWGQLQNVSELSARGDFSEIFDVVIDDGCISIETQPSMWFRDLPYRFGDSSKVVDVFLQIKQKIRIVEQNGDYIYEIKKSNVRIAHTKRVGDRADQQIQVEQGIRFDFDLETQENHPVFHAHYNPNCISGSIPSRFSAEIPDRSYPEYPRIPSAPMDLPGAVFLIMNDHVPSVLDPSEGWPSEPKASLEALPEFPEECFSYHPQDGAKMLCDWWYVHGSNDSGEDNPTRSVYSP